MSQQAQPTIYIIGAGVSGLVAALELERAGFSSLIFDQAEQAGGRLQTDEWNGLPLDRGFQVLLTNYPAALRYLDMEALDLRRFLPGSVLCRGGRPSAFGDPLRHPGFFFDTLLSSHATFSDKWKVWRLAERLKATSLEAIFARPEVSTMSYLTELGFSERIREAFFKPFFAGIFLEPELATSSRMFEFVYKMFSEGHAAIPARGIQAIPRQLASRLEKSEFRLGQAVKQVAKGKITLKDGSELAADHILVTTDPANLIEGYSASSCSWKSCDNLYFQCSSSSLGRPIIGLVTDEAALVNNFHYVTDLLPPPQKDLHLLSVTVVKAHDLEEKDLVARVKQDLEQFCGIRDARFVKRYEIDRALPDLRNLSYAPSPEDCAYAAGIWLAGDFLANGSLNAAMESGRVAAEALIRKLSSAHS